ncbi:hypothetical protein [Paludibaculum fermentans]|uniref:hypothetical protein n=1 Tax=Paludibaculum fermentans TaxID=1473598 RepID=UPI003EB78547
MGTQEPRLALRQEQGAWTHYVSLGHPGSEERAIRNALPASRCSFYERTKWIQEQANDAWLPRLTFPIAEALLRYVKEKGWSKIDWIVLACTENPTHQDLRFDRNQMPVDPQEPAHFDSHHTAQLLTAWLRLTPRHQPLTAAARIHLLTYTDDPHLVQRAMVATEQLIQGIPDLDGALIGASEILIAQSPGLPMINAALLAAVERRNRRAARPVQIDRPAEDLLRLGGLPKESLIRAASAQFLALARLGSEIPHAALDCDYSRLAVLADLVPPFPSGTSPKLSELKAAITGLEGQWRLQPPDRVAGDLDRLARQYRLAVWKLSAAFQRVEQLDSPTCDRWVDDVVWLSGLIFERLRFLIVSAALGVPELVLRRNVKLASLTPLRPRLTELKLAVHSAGLRQIDCKTLSAEACICALQGVFDERRWPAVSAQCPQLAEVREPFLLWVKRVESLRELREQRNLLMHHVQGTSKTQLEQLLLKAAAEWGLQRSEVPAEISRMLDELVEAVSHPERGLKLFQQGARDASADNPFEITSVRVRLSALAAAAMKEAEEL